MPKNTSKGTTAEQRHKVAREAATLLYSRLEKEYRQAKLKAAENLGVHVLPSNLEVALELDQIAEEREGEARRQRLFEMRKDALAIMKVLKRFCPLLIGSVWRGTSRRGSDIDIETYSDKPQQALGVLKANDVEILRSEQVTVTEHGQIVASLHIYAKSQHGHEVEIVVRGTSAKGQKRLCDTYGDQIKGFTTMDLEKLLNIH